MSWTATKIAPTRLSATVRSPPGRISPLTAIVLAIVISLAGFLASWLLSHAFIWVSLAYLAVSLTYSLYWKHQVILDLMAIPACFLLRALAGTTLLEVKLSAWLFVCLSLLALLVSIGKRLHELNLLEESGQVHRPVLADYSRPFLVQALTMASSAAVVSYSVYCISSETAKIHPALVFSVPLVIYSLLRYMYLVFHCDQGGQPEDIFLSDCPMQIAIVLWVVLTIAIFAGLFPHPRAVLPGIRTGHRVATLLALPHDDG